MYSNGGRYKGDTSNLGFDTYGKTNRVLILAYLETRNKN